MQPHFEIPMQPSQTIQLARQTQTELVQTIKISPSSQLKSEHEINPKIIMESLIDTIKDMPKRPWFYSDAETAFNKIFERLNIGKIDEIESRSKRKFIELAKSFYLAIARISNNLEDLWVNKTINEADQKQYEIFSGMARTFYAINQISQKLHDELLKKPTDRTIKKQKTVYVNLLLLFLRVFSISYNIENGDPEKAYEEALLMEKERLYNVGYV